MLKLFILGSCVTRDAFGAPCKNFEVVDYFARSSLISIVSQPLAIEEASLSLPSAFQRKMVLRDFHKNFFSVLGGAKYDFLVIDFIDERFNVLKYKDTYVTESVELINSNIKNSFPFERISRLDMSLEPLWKSSCDNFKKRLLEIMPEEKIVLHKAYWSYKFYDGLNVQAFPQEDLKYYRKMNEILNTYYNYFAGNSNIQQLNFSEEEFIADKNHKWGLSPFHYREQYYENVRSALLNLASLLQN